MDDPGIPTAAPRRVRGRAPWRPDRLFASPRTVVLIACVVLAVSTFLPGFTTHGRAGFGGVAFTYWQFRDGWIVLSILVLVAGAGGALAALLAQVDHVNPLGFAAGLGGGLLVIGECIKVASYAQSGVPGVPASEIASVLPALGTYVALGSVAVLLVWPAVWSAIVGHRRSEAARLGGRLTPAGGWVSADTRLVWDSDLLTQPHAPSEPYRPASAAVARGPGPGAGSPPGPDGPRGRRPPAGPTLPPPPALAPPGPGSPAAGWYADPVSAGQLRWWDGTDWTDDGRPGPA